MDTLHAGELSTSPIEQFNGDGDRGHGGLQRAATAPSLSGLLRASYDKVHLFGRLHLRKDLKTSHFGGNWKRRWCMLRGCNILIFKSEQAGVAFAEHATRLGEGPRRPSTSAAQLCNSGAEEQQHLRGIRKAIKPHQIIELGACKRVLRSGALENMRFTFKIILPGRLPVIAAAARAELKSWVDTLEAVLAGETNPEIRVNHSFVLRGNVHIRKSGTMYHLGFNWKQRHMVLDGRHIVITKTDNPEDPVRRELKLLSTSRCGPLSAERPHTFVVINFHPVVGDAQPLVVSASDDEKMMRWARTVQQAIQEVAWKEAEQSEGRSVDSTGAQDSGPGRARPSPNSKRTAQPVKTVVALVLG